MVTSDLLNLDVRRRKLGMSKRILAERSGVSEPTVARILSGKEKRPSIANVEAIANALGAQLRLEIPSEDFPFREAQARAKARRLVGMVQSTMALESQAVSPQIIEEMVAETTHNLLAGSRLRLWEQ